MAGGGKADTARVCPHVGVLPGPHNTSALYSTVREAAYKTENLHLGFPGADPEQVGARSSSASVPTLSLPTCEPL